MAGPLIEESLLHMINLSINSGTFPSAWKRQLILPLHKKKEKEEMSSYRPVCHLIQVGIILEYVVFDQITEHFQKHNLFHPNHHGSLANHSTTTAMAHLHQRLIEASENQQLSALCLLDQQAAYDLLPHDSFQQKLKLYNFSEESVSWVRSYLQDRSQQVQVESKMSPSLPCGDHAL